MGFVRRRAFGTAGEGRLEGVAHGHTVTYLHSIFAREAPEVYSKLRALVMQVGRMPGWGSLGTYPEGLGIRTIEHLEYSVREGRGDGLGWHQDSGSVVTLNVMMSESDEYEGGQLQYAYPVGSCGDVHNVTMKKGGVSVYYSMTDHRVTPLTTGRREVMVMELWDRAANSYPARPPEFYVCRLRPPSD